MGNIETLTDEETAALVQKGNKKAYEALVVKYEPKIRNYVNYLLSTSEHTDDVIQDTFISAYRNINAFNLSKKYSSWLYRIAHNKAIDHVRKASKLRINVDFDLMESVLPAKETPESSYEKEEIATKVKKCLIALPIKYREILTLYYLEDRNYEELRDILQININNVGVRLNRGKKLLKAICIQGGSND